MARRSGSWIFGLLVVMGLCATVGLRRSSEAPLSDGSSCGESLDDETLSPASLAAPPVRVPTTRGPAAASPATQPTPRGRRTATLTGGVVRAEDGAPIALAKIALSFHDDTDSHDTDVEIESDRRGGFVAQIEIDRDERLDDASCPEAGRCVQRVSMDGSTERIERVVARPGQTVRFTIELAERALVQGVVVDEEGRPVSPAQLGLCWPGRSQARGASRDWLETSSKGRFALYAYAHPAEVFDPDMSTEVSTLYVRAAGRALSSFDLRRLSEAERAEWRIVLRKGHRIAGRLQDESGRALVGVTVSVAFGAPEALCTARTDAHGRFTLEPVGDGDATVGAYVSEGALEARRALRISSDLEDCLLVARPIDLAGTPGAVNVMGMRMIDLDGAAHRTRDLPGDVGVLVVDAGVVGQVAGIYRIESGDCILMVGGSSVTSVVSLIDALLAEYDRGAPQEHLAIPVVTTRWNSTQYLKVDPLEMERLRRARASMR